MVVPRENNAPHEVVIVGGGFGGLYAAKALSNTNVNVTLIDKRNFHLFQPLLYQVATGTLSPADISAPLRSVFSSSKNTKVLWGEVSNIDPQAQQVFLGDQVVPYDTLVVATGANHSYFGKDNWKEFAPGLKTVEDAIEMRRRIFSAFEAAEQETRPGKTPGVVDFCDCGRWSNWGRISGGDRRISIPNPQRRFPQY